MRILVTGATGFVGRALCARLAGEHQIVAVSRDAARAQRKLGGTADVIAMPDSPAEWASAVDGCDGVVNLAGESIAAGRWTEERKGAIVSSRVDLTRSLATGIASAGKPPRVLVSASAIGYYGARGDEILDETAPAGDDFLARVCVGWEDATQAAEAAGTRTVHLRIGIVLGDDGGALQQMVMPFKLFLGGPMGSGKQWMSWIHRDDLLGLIELGLTDGRAAGAVNCTAPEPKTMRDFSKTLGKVLGRPSWAPVPAFVLELALGEMSTMLLNGQRVVPAAAEALGYKFRFPELEAALADLLK